MINITNTIHIAKITYRVSIRLIMIIISWSFTLTNFWNKKKALNNLSNSVTILPMGTMGEIDKWKAVGASLHMEPVFWNCLLRTVFWSVRQYSAFAVSPRYNCTAMAESWSKCARCDMCQLSGVRIQFFRISRGCWEEEIRWRCSATRLLNAGISSAKETNGLGRTATAQNVSYIYLLVLVLGMALNCLHRVIVLQHPGANGLWLFKCS